MTKKIAYITYQPKELYTQGLTENEDLQLLTFLQKKGWDIAQCIWDDSTVNWQEFDVAICKSPWDYHEKYPAFLEWMNQLSQMGVSLLNPAAVIRWNSDKHYLLDIADKGLKVIPTLYLEKGEVPNLGELLNALNTEKIIIKPCISAGAKNTIALGEEDISTAVQNNVYELLQKEAYMVQPFMKEIKEGEWSFLFFNGVFSHALIKTPKQGDFRVQHYFGGSIAAVNPVNNLIEQAGHYVKTFAKGCLYARVDGIISDNTFLLMELELIEPYLFLHTNERAYDNYHEALMQLIN